MIRHAAMAAGLALVATAAGCGSSNAQTSPLTVFAAASLTEAFTRIGQDVERADPGVRVAWSFGPSDGLAGQIREGAPADVFASASPKWMDDVAANGPGVTTRSIFARNSLAVIVPSENPRGIGSLRDLARPGVKLVLAAPGVPAGDYARQALDQAGIADAAESNLVSNEEDVKAVVQKVLLGEADAGIVYRTDVTQRVRPLVAVIEIPEDVNVLAAFTIAVMRGSETEAAGRRFVQFVMGPGQETLRTFGFLPAEPATG